MSGNLELQPEAQDDATPRTLGPGSLVSLGLGGVVGAGVFVSIGIAAHDKAGPAIIVSFLIAAIACIAVALCYCECASRIPIAGSTYAYGRAALGEIGGWLSGWNLVTCYFLAGAAVAQGWSGYFQSFLGALGYGWPARFGGAPIDLDQVHGGIVASGAMLNLPAVLILTIVSIIAYRGIKMSMGVNNLLLGLKLTTLLVVVAVGLAHFRLANWLPFAPYGWGGIGPGDKSGDTNAHGSAGVLAGAAMVFFAFGGFEMLSAYSHECKRPQTDVPRGVIATIGAITSIYIAVAIALTGMIPSSKISISAPISDAFRTINMDWAQLLVAFGAVVGMSSVLLVLVMSLPRVLFGISQGGLLPGWFGRTHTRFNTPYRSIQCVGVIACIASALLPLRILMDFVMTCTLAGYISVCVFVLILRRRQSTVQPEFHIMGGPIVPVAGVLICLMMIVAVPLMNLAALGLWLLIGRTVYAAIRRVKGQLHQPSQAANRA